MPISHALRKTAGYRLPYLDYPVTHQYFMDDLKVYAKSSNALDATLRVVDSVVCGRDGAGAQEVCHHPCETGQYVSGENYLLPEERTIE